MTAGIAEELMSLIFDIFYPMYLIRLTDSNKNIVCITGTR